MLEEFDRELGSDSQGSFYLWVHKNFSDFEKMREEFSRSCDDYLVSNHGYVDQCAWGMARATYFKYLIDKIPEFRRIKNVDETTDFINSFKK